MAVAALALRGARGLLDLMLPPRCLRCGLTVDGQDRLCVECWRSLTFLGPPQCRLCGYPLPHALPEAPLCGACTREAPVYDRASLAAGQRLGGPAIIEERETTTVIPPGWAATIDPLGCIIARKG